MSSSSEEEPVPSTPLEFCEVQVDQLNNDLSLKSKEKYNSTYESFLTWKNENNKTSFSEKVLLAYFKELALKYRAGSLWAYYSMLKTTLKIKNCVSIDKYLKLKAFLKQQSEGYVPKKSKVLTREDVEKFVNEAPDSEYLATKVALILGVTGSLRGPELCHLTVDNIENQGEMLLVNIPNKDNRIPKSFVVSGNFCKVVKKYQSLRCTKAPTNRFFQQYRNGKCTAQVMGKNKIGNVPKEIAQYLKLPDASSYTGHSFRGTSAKLLVHSGVHISTMKKRRRSSSCVTEGYIELQRIVEPQSSFSDTSFTIKLEPPEQGSVTSNFEAQSSSSDTSFSVKLEPPEQGSVITNLEPQSTSSDTLFSVRLEPPKQGSVIPNLEPQSSSLDTSFTLNLDPLKQGSVITTLEPQSSSADRSFSLKLDQVKQGSVITNLEPQSSSADRSFSLKLDQLKQGSVITNSEPQSSSEDTSFTLNLDPLKQGSVMTNLEPQSSSSDRFFNLKVDPPKKGSVITNSIQTIKYPEKNITLNISNNNNCTITFKFDK